MADWAKIDVGFLRHPQVCQLTRAEQVGYLALILYAQEYETDGAIPVQALKLCGVSKREAASMVAAGLLVRTDPRDRWCDPGSGSGFVIDGFTRKQPTREQLQKKRSDARARRERRMTNEQ